MKTLFVTCGATVPFPQLVDAVVRKEFLEELSTAGFQRVIVQHGKGYELEFQSKLEELKCSAGECSLAHDALATSISGLSSNFYDRFGVEIIGIEYSTRVHDLVQMADLVVSHAGTGSILDSLRLGKPLIVCVNDNLMDNHQQQIADEFEKKGYVWACKPSGVEISRCLRRSQQEKLNKFPHAYSGQFENDLMRLAFK